MGRILGRPNGLGAENAKIIWNASKYSLFLFFLDHQIPNYVLLLLFCFFAYLFFIIYYFTLFYFLLIAIANTVGCLFDFQSLYILVFLVINRTSVLFTGAEYLALPDTFATR